MRLIHDHDNIVTLRKDRIFFAFVEAELLDKGEHKALVECKILAQLLAIFRLRGVAVQHGMSVDEILIDLAVQVFAVGNDDKRIAAFEFAEDFADQEDHGE